MVNLHIILGKTLTDIKKNRASPILIFEILEQKKRSRNPLYLSGWGLFSKFYILLKIRAIFHALEGGGENTEI